MRKLLSSILASLVFGSYLYATAVSASYSGTASNTAGSATTIQLTSFTVSSGTNLCLIAALATNGTTSGVTMHWDTAGGNQLMTAGPTVTNGSKISIFYLINPAVGNLILQADWTTSRSSFIGAVAFKNTDPALCIKVADSATNTGSSTTASLNVTSAVNDVTVGMAAAGSSFSSTDLSATEIFRGCASAVRCAGSYYLGVNASPNVHQFTLSSAAWAVVGVHVLSDTTNTCSGGMSLLGVGKGC